MAVSRALHRDMCEVLELSRGGGTLVQRDAETLVASGCGQVASAQIMLLTSLHPRVHFTVCPSERSSSEDRRLEGVTVIATQLPSVHVLLSGDVMQMLLAGVLFTLTLHLHAVSVAAS